MANADEYYCNKCGYVGPVSYQHARPRVEPIEFCGYQAILVNKIRCCPCTYKTIAINCKCPCHLPVLDGRKSGMR